jgi:uncharacterized protein (TIGR03437 family)
VASVLWIFGVLSGPAFSQVSFSAQKDYPTPFPNCCALVKGDFNGDGRVDLIASPVYSQTPGLAPLLYLQNNGDGTFTAKNIVFGLATSLSVVGAADLDGDGKLDLVGQDLVTRHGVWLAGHGDGTFDPPVDLGIDTLAAVADFRGDKVPDLLVSLGFLDYVVRSGDGKGAFKPAVSQYGDSFAVHVSVGDINGDGILDLIGRTPVHNDNQMLYIGLGQKDGSFKKTLLDSTNYGGGVLGDVDQDGKLDIVQFGSAYGKPGLAVRRGNGDGGFLDPVFSPSNASTPYGVADFDGDGKADVLSSFTFGGLSYPGNQPPAIAVSLGNGDLTFRNPITFGRVSLAHMPTIDSNNPLVIADFNGDGKPDVAFPSADSTLSVMLNDTNAKAPRMFVSAADWAPHLAPGSIGVVLGTGLATTTAVNHDNPAPEVLGGVRVRVLDGDGRVANAQLLYVSPGQINFVMPVGPGDNGATVLGYATITVDNGSGTPEEAQSVLAQPVAPAFFTADGSGTGAPLGYVVRTHPDQTQTSTPVFSCSGNQCQPAAIDLSGDDPASLVLFGTGLRGTAFVSALNRYNAYCTLTAGQTGANLVPDYIGPQGQYPGLDQVNIPLPSTLRGVGDAPLTCIFSAAQPSLSYPVQSAPLSLRFR